MLQSQGNTAETQVREFLEQEGYCCLGQNWRTPQCEIDLIMCRDGCLYFVEVKYRETQQQGEGYEYITAEKLRRMQRGVHIWLSDTENRIYRQHDKQLVVASVAGWRKEEISLFFV